jgi:hypothetical protein
MTTFREPGPEPQKPTHVERVVRAARSSHGVCRVDFQAPTIDGLEPILNFPGRMFDAHKAGYTFEVIGKRHRCKVFRLVETTSTEAPASGDRPLRIDVGLPGPEHQAGAGASVEDVRAVADAAAEPKLFETEPGTRSHYEDAAA